jgi:hypothetical protein
MIFITKKIGKINFMKKLIRIRSKKIAILKKKHKFTFILFSLYLYQTWLNINNRPEHGKIEKK